MQYEAIAPMYDRLMRHVEYEKWVSLIDKVIARYGASRDPEILEIGAGTGVVGKSLRDMGYQYTASDLSFYMCKEAHGRRGLEICVADARHLPFKKQFGMAMFLYDGINYLPASDDYRKFFASIHDVLMPGGLLLFDITTRENSRKHFSDYLDFEDYGDFSYVRHSYFNEAKSTQHNDFTVYSRSEKNPESYGKHTETHTQRIFSVGEIEKFIPKRRFSVLGIWDDYTFRRYSGKSLRVHFLLRRLGDKRSP